MRDRKLEGFALNVRHQLVRARRKALRVVGRSPAGREEALESFARQVDPDQMQAYAGSALARLYYGHQGRLAYKWDHYLPIYERHLARYLGSAVRLLEIGVYQGGSLQLWRKYFGPSAIIFGIDVNPRCRAVDDPGVCIRIGSQADPKFLKSVIREMGRVDIVIDDGSHLASEQRVCFQTLFPLLAPNGVYIVEDLHTSYWSDYEGGVRRGGTFIEEMKVLIDDMHAWYSEVEQRVADAHKTVDGIHFYDSVVVVEKRPKERPFHTKVGVPSF